MALTLTPAPVRTTGPSAWWARREEQRRLAEIDRRQAHLAELHGIRSVLAAAGQLIEVGWLQHAWYRYRNEAGRERTITAYSPPRADDEVVAGACLVGALIEAGGGLPAARSQLVQRTLDLTWHTLFTDGRDPVRWCPAPPIRAIHLRDLTAWNDRYGRRRSEVAGLLEESAQTADREIARLRAVGTGK
jgi:hypothetical protein